MGQPAARDPWPLGAGRALSQCHGQRHHQHRPPARGREGSVRGVRHLGGGGDAATAAGNATKEIGRDGTSAYLGSLHTSAERFFLNNLVREQGSKCSKSSKW